jgi:release factor glutamine methyltransferase
MPSKDSSTGPHWTIIRALEWTAGYFKQLGIAQPRAVAEILLAHVLDCSRIDLYLRHDQPLNDQERTGFKQLIRRRAGFEPEAYIVGRKEFWSLTLHVSSDVLIPRPETECVVEAVLDRLPAYEGVHVLELGTGSGAISIALAHERSQWRFSASDLSDRAIAMAQANARRLVPEAALEFFAGRWFEAVDSGAVQFDAIVSNPPYIPSAHVARLQREICDFEPRQALDGGPDGLDCLTHIIDAAPIYLKPEGWLILEMGYDQQERVEAIARRNLAYDRIDFRKDYGGYPRVTQLRRRAAEGSPKI